jgi:transcriptional regulator with XRE-family HTH domain
MAPRTPDLNPGDLTARRNITRKLRDLRIELGIPQNEIADAMWITFSAVSKFELRNPPNPHISQLQRYARALSRTIRLHLEHLPADPTGDPEGHLLARLEQSTDPTKADQAHRARTLHRLITARKRLNISQKDLAGRLNTTPSALCLVEAAADDPLLATYQRYARALGGRLATRIHTEPSTDHVLVARAVAGKPVTLSHTEKIAAARQLARTGSSAAHVEQVLGVSGSSAQRLLALAAEQEAA